MISHIGTISRPSGKTANAVKSNRPALLETYVSAYRSIMAASVLTPQERDIMLLSMFYEKGCFHCLAAHSFINKMLIHPSGNITDPAKNISGIPAEKLTALINFSRAVASKKGYSKLAIENILEHFTEKHMLTVIATHGILTWNNSFSEVYKEPLYTLSKNRIWNIAEIGELEMVINAS